LLKQPGRGGGIAGRSRSIRRLLEGHRIVSHRRIHGPPPRKRKRRTSFEARRSLCFFRRL
jgi:hypothetical protein